MAPISRILKNYPTYGSPNIDLSGDGIRDAVQTFSNSNLVVTSGPVKLDELSDPWAMIGIAILVALWIITVVTIELRYTGNHKKHREDTNQTSTMLVEAEFVKKDVGYATEKTPLLWISDRSAEILKPVDPLHVVLVQ